MSLVKIATFDDWVDLFREWQREIGYDVKLLGDYRFEAKLGETIPEVEFGDYSGQRKWERLTDIPDQRIQDALLHLITYQGDTEFASVEQQRHLTETAPSDYDLQSLVRINREEMRHGFQMCYLLVNHFGSAGRTEARKLLERRPGRTGCSAPSTCPSSTGSISSATPSSWTGTGSISSPCSPIPPSRRSRGAWARCSRRSSTTSSRGTRGSCGS